MSKKRVDDLVSDIVVPFLEKADMELEDIEFVKEGQFRYLRVFIDKEEGVDPTIIALARAFPSTIQGFTEQEAKNLIEKSPPIAQIKKFIKSKNKQKMITSYQAIHLGFNAQALLVESLIRKYKKEGEIAAYDYYR